jgi:hypothetical protein
MGRPAKGFSGEEGFAGSVGEGGTMRKQTSGASVVLSLRQPNLLPSIVLFEIFLAVQSVPMGYDGENRKLRRYIWFRYSGLASRTRMSTSHSRKSSDLASSIPGGSFACACVLLRQYDLFFLGV